MPCYNYARRIRETGMHWLKKGFDVGLDRALISCCVAAAIFYVYMQGKEGSFDKDILFSTFHCSRPCIIHASEGGTVGRFLNAAEELKAEHALAIIDGWCASACTVFADKARPNVCITRRAVFLFHQATDDFTSKHEDPSRFYSPGIVAWVRAHGGFPTEGALQMHVRDATTIWPLCNEVNESGKSDRLAVIRP